MLVNMSVVLHTPGGVLVLQQVAVNETDKDGQALKESLRNDPFFMDTVHTFDASDICVCADEDLVPGLTSCPDCGAAWS